MKIKYVEKRFHPKTLAIIEKANLIVDEYAAAGFQLTLRQLYYQFVARDLIENTQKSYKNLGNIINDARLAGLMSWEAIEDRTRNLRARSHWDDPSGVINAAAHSYGKDLWRDIDKRIEVWIEKDALIGVIERMCTKWDVPYFSCRGYTSQSELWGAAMRHRRHEVSITVIHLGDHDPSGIDMTRDIQDRLEIFGANTRVHRIALNMDQVRKHKLPPNPAKVTDSRFENYKDNHGDECWELDALDPKNIERMLDGAIKSAIGRDLEQWEANHDEQETERGLLIKASKYWPKIEVALNKRKK
jgi:hypothetical protein